MDSMKTTRGDVAVPARLAFAGAQAGSAFGDDQFTEGVTALLELAERGLPKMFRSSSHEFAFTRRGRRVEGGGTANAGQGWQTRLDGVSVRYGAIVALGAQHLPIDRQQAIFGGETVEEFCTRLTAQIGSFADFGEVALVAWLAAELGHSSSAACFDVLTTRVAAARTAPTVETAWALTAAVAFAERGGDADLESLLVDRILSARGGDGVLFPHNVVPASQPWYRARVGCFADQVYPIQALARQHRRTSNMETLNAAQACAQRICDLQGDAGQWWWHYDWKNGDVIEGYPVYSVHQHAMAPMALFDLVECGGTDLSESIRLGVKWLTDAPETTTPLIDDELDVVWRKVARREPKPKVVRALRAAARPAGLSAATRWLNVVAPPGSIDFECRPYELGWLLYAWLHRIEPSRHESATLAAQPTPDEAPQ
jgi:hypothetical protein